MGRLTTLVGIGTLSYFISNEAFAQRVENKSQPAIVINDDGRAEALPETYKVVLKFKTPETDDEKWVYEHNNNDPIIYMNWVRVKTQFKFAKEMSDAMVNASPEAFSKFLDILIKDETGSFVPLEDMRKYLSSNDSYQGTRDPTKKLPKPVFYQQDELGRLVPITKTSIDSIVLPLKNDNANLKSRTVQNNNSLQEIASSQLKDSSKVVKMNSKEVFDFSLGKIVDGANYNLYPYFDGDFYLYRNKIETIRSNSGVIINVGFNGVFLYDNGHIMSEIKSLNDTDWDSFIDSMKKMMKKYDKPIDSVKPLYAQDINDTTAMAIPGGIYFIKSRDRNGVGVIKIIDLIFDKNQDELSIKFEWRYYPAEPNKVVKEDDAKKMIVITENYLKSIDFAIMAYTQEKYRTYPSGGNAVLVKVLQTLGGDGLPYFEFTAKNMKDGLLIDVWGRPIIYLESDKIYSVGPNGIDEKGKGDDISRKL